MGIATAGEDHDRGVDLTTGNRKITSEHGRPQGASEIHVHVSCGGRYPDRLMRQADGLERRPDPGFLARPRGTPPGHHPALRSGQKEIQVWSRRLEFQVQGLSGGP